MHALHAILSRTRLKKRKEGDKKGGTKKTKNGIYERPSATASDFRVRDFSIFTFIFLRIIIPLFRLSSSYNILESVAHVFIYLFIYLFSYFLFVYFATKNIRVHV